MRHNSFILAAALGIAGLVSGCTDSVSPSEFAGVTVPRTALPPEVPSAAVAPCTEAEKAAIPDVASYSPSTSTARLEEIINRGRIRVGVSSDTLLFGFRNPISGRLEGLDIDLIREVTKTLFSTDQVPVTDANVDSKIEFKVIPYRDRIPKLQSKEIDLVAHSMTINCVRWKQIAFSSQYYSAGQRVLVRSDLEASGIKDLKAGTKVCIPAGGTSVATLAQEGPELIPVEVLDITECLVKLQNSEVDAALSDDTVLAGFIRQDPYLKMVGEPITEEPYGLGVNAENVALAQFVNGVLESLRTTGKIKELFDRNSLSEATVPPADHSRVVVG
jgi:polar amino acid transport system substrate-binding protein